MTSDLLPRLGGLADDFCFIHSLTGKTNTHGPGENYMSTGFTLDGFPSHGRLGQLRPRQRQPTICPPSSPSPTRAACRRRAGNNWGSAASCPPPFRARR